MHLNAKKSVCIRFGARFDAICNDLVSMRGDVLQWVNKCRYLGVFFTSARSFRCSFDIAKRKFFSSFNAMYSKVGSFKFISCKMP